MSGLTSPNLQQLLICRASGLAFLCWIPHSSSEGPQTTTLFFSSTSFLSPLFLVESAVSSEHAGVTSQLTSFYRWGQRQVNSQDSAEKRGPRVTLPCGLLTPVSLILSFSCQPLYSGCSWAQRLGRSAAYLRGHLAVYEGGWDILYKPPPPPIIWTVTNEASPLTSTDEQPRAGLGSLSGANDIKSGSLIHTHACIYYRYLYM